MVPDGTGGGGIKQQRSKRSRSTGGLGRAPGSGGTGSGSGSGTKQGRNLWGGLKRKMGSYIALTSSTTSLPPAGHRPKSDMLASSRSRWSVSGAAAVRGNKSGVGTRAGAGVGQDKIPHSNNSSASGSAHNNLKGGARQPQGGAVENDSSENQSKAGSSKGDSQSYRDGENSTSNSKRKRGTVSAVIP
jgi:hypothetical protein